jgi:hypothetical protein
MRRTIGPALAAAAALLFAAGCSEPTVPDIPYGLASAPLPLSRTVVVDSARLALVGDPAERAGGVFRFAVVGQPQEIAAGDVIIGVQGGGFLRRVTSARMADDHLVLSTQAAGLDEAVGAGSFHGSAPLSVEAGAVHGPSYTLGPVTTQVVADGITLDKAGLRFNSVRVFDSRRCGTPGGTCGQITLGVTSGYAGFTSRLDMDGKATLVGGITEAHLSVSGTATMNVDAYAQVEGAVQGGPWKRTLLTQSRPFVMMVAGLPVAGTVTVELIGELSAVIEGPARIDAGVTSTTAATVGAGWTRRSGFYRILSRNPQTWSRPVRITDYPKARFTFIIEPKVTVSLLAGTAESYIGLRPYLTFNLYPFPGLDVARTRVDFGLGAEAGVSFNVFSANLGTYTYRGHILERLVSLDSFAIPRIPTGIERKSSNLQRNYPGMPLRDPIIARVVNNWGRAVEGVRVNFVVTSGGGTLSAASGVSDSLGQVQVRWTLGPTIGTQTVTASSPAIPGRTAQFRATAIRR